MAYRVTHQSDRELGVVEFWGSVSSEQIVSALVALLGADEWSTGWNALWDTRRIEVLIVDLHGLEAVANWKQYFADVRHEGRSAVVAERPTESEIARLLLRYRETTPRKTQVFATVAEATQFLRTEWEPGAPTERVTALFTDADEQSAPPKP